MPIDYKNYPKNWRQIQERINRRSHGCCEGSPAYPRCRAVNYLPHPITGSKVILTIGHRDHDPMNNRLSNLRHWCQRCHLTYDAVHHAKNASHTRAEKKTKGIIPIWEIEK
jgi:hypothetical protein